ncbi:MAG: hypothetical protein ACYDD1_00150 [Caulobacteraceae bacterium]
MASLPGFADAAQAHHKRPVHSSLRAASHDGGANAQLRELRDEVHALQASQAQTQAQLRDALETAHEAQTQILTAQAQIQAAQAQEADATAAVQSIPSQVAAAVDMAKPKTDKIYYKGLSITLGGFLEAANQYRSRALGSDMFSPFNTIPFANSRTGHESEDRFSARQSRLSALVQGDVNASTQLAMYGEFDFLGAAQSANSTESNSFTPRIRHLYATIDWKDTGWHLLAGQTWTLATMNSNGITPRNEVVPMGIDAQFVPGFVWLRQPQFRITKDMFDHKLWIALSVEQPQTTFAGTVPADVVDSITDSTGLFAGAANGSAPVTAGGPTTATAATTATSSLNHIPDVVAKVAYEMPLYGRSLHLEAFGVGRAFTDRIGSSEDTVYGGGIGGGFLLPLVPKLVDLQGSILSGRGIGRYGTSQLPDVTFRSDGRIEPIGETDFLLGATLHATKLLDVYAYAGEEHENRKSYAGGYGYADNTLGNAGCLTEGGACSAASKLVEQLTAGFWQKIYQGPYGRMQVGVQYSYTQRDAYSGLNELAPIGNDSIVFTSFRYYPF